MMKYVPLEKRSKRAQKEYNARQRGSWNGVVPVTRIGPDASKYDRSRQRRENMRSQREEAW